MTKYVGFTLVDASPVKTDEGEGFNVMYEDGTAVFIPKEVFEENFQTLDSAEGALNKILTDAQLKREA